MKTNLIVIAFILAGFTGMAQTTLLDSNYRWVNGTLNDKTVMTYGLNGNKTQEIIKLRNGNQWTNYAKRTFVYDANDNVTTQTYLNWTGTAFVNYERFVWTYDGSNRIATQIYKQWSGAAWVNSTKFVNTYDSNGNLTKQISYSWNGSVFEKVSQDVYTYAQNKVTLLVAKLWNSTAWVNYSKDVYSYDANGMPDTTTVWDWDGVKWVKFSRAMFTYSGNKLMSIYSQTYSSPSWVFFANTTCAYDQNGNRIDSTTTYAPGTFPNTQTVSTYDNSNNLKSRVNHPDEDSTIYYYHVIPSPSRFETIAQVETEITVYPNPSTGLFNFSGVKEENIISVFDVNGKLISNDVFNGSGVDLSSGDKGIYFYTVQSSGAVIKQGKLILQ